MTALTTARLVDDDGTGLEVLRLDSTLGVIVNSVDVGFPEARSVTAYRSAQDGTVDTTQYVGARSVTAEVTLPTVGWYNVEDLLRAAMHPGNRYYLYLLRDGWTEERRLLVRGATYTSSMREPRVAQLGWAAVTGTMEGSVSALALMPTFNNQEGGIATPFSTPVTLAPGFNPGASSILVDGTAATFPVAIIYGPCANPALFLSGSQQTLAFNLTIASGNYLQVDFAARTALLNNNTALSQYGSIDFSRSSWWQLQPGLQQVAFNPASASGTAQAVLQWRPRYI